MTPEELKEELKSLLGLYNQNWRLPKFRDMPKQWYERFRAVPIETLREALRKWTRDDPVRLPTLPQIERYVGALRQQAPAELPEEPREVTIQKLRAEVVRNWNNGNDRLATAINDMLNVTVENDEREAAGRPLLRYPIRELIRSL